ncbi:MAG TPA: NAD(P)-binding domain-containing protein, partial [Kaistia sp.]|nr:NAD(P)-binding domain-containing protein [Kaistia sp.]
MSNRTVGFIGLGFMGEGMATNLLTKGNPLLVMANRRREAVERLLALGAHEVATPADMARGADVIFLCVTGSRDVEQVIE